MSSWQCTSSFKYIVICRVSMADSCVWDKKKQARSSLTSPPPPTAQRPSPMWVSPSQYASASGRPLARTLPPNPYHSGRLCSAPSSTFMPPLRFSRWSCSWRRRLFSRSRCQKRVERVSAYKARIREPATDVRQTALGGMMGRVAVIST